jgi:hypothetical protein
LGAAAAACALALVLLPTVTVRAQPPASWQTWSTGLAGATDVAGPIGGALAVATSTGLVPAGSPRSATTSPSPAPASGGELVDIVASPSSAAPGSACAFPAGTVYGLPAGSPVRVVMAGGEPPTVATLGSGMPAGIAMDVTGRFGGRLLVALAVSGGTEVDALDCAGRTSRVTASGPSMRGGMAVAPAGFGAFGGRLVGVDPTSATVVAVGSDGVAESVAASGLTKPVALGFVPPGFSDGGWAYAAAGGSVLRIAAADLVAGGVRDGDLLVSAADGRSVDIRCGAGGGCSRPLVVAGPTAGETIAGHLLLVPDTPGPQPSPLPPGRIGAAQQSGPLGLLPYAVGVVILAAIVLLYWRQTRRRL